MSIPGIPDINPKMTLARDDAINLLLSAMAMEQLSLTQILAAEGDKIKFALGTLPGTEYDSDTTVDELMTIDQSVKETLDTAIRLEMLLQSRLETLLRVPVRPEARGAIGVIPTLAEVEASESDEIMDAGDKIEAEEDRDTEEAAEHQTATEFTEASEFTPIPTISGFGANTAGVVLSVATEGIDIPLPDNLVLQGITVDDSRTTFTVPADGNYLITYVIQFTEALPIRSRLMMNDQPFTPTVISSQREYSSFTNTVMIPLEEGDTIALQVYGLDEEVGLLAGAGATLTIVKL